MPQVAGTKLFEGTLRILFAFRYCDTHQPFVFGRMIACTKGSVTKTVLFTSDGFQLQTFYSWALDAALSVTNKIVESNSDVPEVKVCNAALRLMHQILNWEFRYSKGGTKGSINVFPDGMRSDTASSRKTECVIVQVVNGYI